MLRISKVLTGIVVTVIQATWMCAFAYAGEYHYGNTLNCSDCHASHASLTHNQTGAPLNWSPTPASHLTKGETVTKMCLACHDNQPGIPDVLGVDVNNPTERYDGSERAAGQFSDTNSDNWKGHNLPGQGTQGPGECTACHDPHGNNNYRNLRALDGSQDGPVAFVDPMATGLDRYKRSNIGYAKNIGDKLCVRCHEFGASSNTVATGGVGRFHRHPSSDQTMIITIADAGGRDGGQHWVNGIGSGFNVEGVPVPRVPFAVNSATNFKTATTVTADNEVFCLSCHKAHGSVHSFGMIWPYGSGSDGLVSSSGCNQCHNISEG